MNLSLATTDVQSVSICLVRGTTYLIHCNYVMGSDARGCVYVITGDDVMGNVTGTIARSNSIGVIAELADGNTYSEIFAYDWENDNSSGSLPVLESILSIETCPITTTATIITG